LKLGGKPARRIFLVVTVIASMCRLIAADDDGKILRPADHASYSGNEVDLIATAVSGSLQLDGMPIQASQPFPNVFHTSLKVSPGLHTVVLTWKGGRKEVQFFAGAGARAGFQPFHQHPPIPGVQCTQCHEINRHGRFVFKGGCFECHQRGDFAKIHTHEPSILEQCGMCHNAHGSTVKAHLLYPKETACKICHN